MKGYAMLKIGESGWIEKEVPKCGPMDAICRPLAVAICTSDVHTLWEGAIGIVIVIPIACAYPFFQKYFISGLTIGAVKG